MNEPSAAAYAYGASDLDADASDRHMLVSETSEGFWCSGSLRRKRVQVASLSPAADLVGHVFNTCTVLRHSAVATGSASLLCLKALIMLSAPLQSPCIAMLLLLMHHTGGCQSEDE